MPRKGQKQPEEAKKKLRQKALEQFKDGMSEETKQKISNTLQGRKFSEEHIKNLSGENHHMYGKHHSEETRKKIRKSEKGCIPWNTGKKCPQLSGENNPNWKGGLTSLKELIRKCFKYRQWRSDIFTRDDFTCVLCGKRDGGELVADHIKAFSVIFHENKIEIMEEALNCEEFWNINNGRTLCKKCHEKTDNYGGRSNKNLTVEKWKYKL